MTFKHNTAFQKVSENDSIGYRLNDLGNAKDRINVK